MAAPPYPQWFAWPAMKRGYLRHAPLAWSGMARSGMARSGMKALARQVDEELQERPRRAVMRTRWGGDKSSVDTEDLIQRFLYT